MPNSQIPPRFDAKCVVITGAGAGIGRATALRFARAGARVIATDMKQDRLNTVQAELPGTGHAIVAGDITLSDTIERIMQVAGAVDILINNAGIMDAFLPAAELDDAMWDKVMTVNLTAPMRLTRAVLPGMLARGNGAIVNVTSEAGLRGSIAGAAYTTSKHGLIGLTRSTAFMYGPSGVRCNAVAPGAVETSIEAPFNSALAAARIGPIMQATMPSAAKPDQLAASICWLASDETSNINGVILPCDGGWSVV
ncbi:SDR family NAD(P)-dependent oxidoreductase [Thalassovita taeanensis]|uniref:NAD(P)-dependent dehydrogenase, short-chain alcohol dehydrogenase family n=1 Tax=Thalassovita taeanensis TaxID=657014 RepID=A0A1H9G4I2_9RHOB|nr:SDR family NAD(P)-dependent oxidoreductase [Thalassovita taeanensis]SEQ44964.1 NAD(P)-dependent dehydrogenase, short-chain alcohol dehydrogenase family [Thalassovita taeanensis]